MTDLRPNRLRVIGSQGIGIDRKTDVFCVIYLCLSNSRFARNQDVVVARRYALNLSLQGSLDHWKLDRRDLAPSLTQAPRLLCDDVSKSAQAVLSPGHRISRTYIISPLDTAPTGCLLNYEARLRRSSSPFPSSSIICAACKVDVESVRRRYSISPTVLLTSHNAPAHFCATCLRTPPF